jgi:hypothetical protein
VWEFVVVMEDIRTLYFLVGSKLSSTRPLSASFVDEPISQGRDGQLGWLGLQRVKNLALTLHIGLSGCRRLIAMVLVGLEK